jgi:hypothetical protein
MTSLIVERFWKQVIECTKKDANIICIGFRSLYEKNRYQREQENYDLQERTVVFWTPDPTARCNAFPNYSEDQIVIIFNEITTEMLFLILNFKTYFQLLHSKDSEEYLDVSDLSIEKLDEYNKQNLIWLAPRFRR